MADLNIAVVLMVGFVGMIFGFISVIGTMVGLFIWLDRKHSARMDRIDKRIDGILDDMREMRGEMREIQRNMRVLNSKIDRAQGALDVLIFGDRGVPPPVAHDRAEAQFEEAVGD